MDFYDSVPGDRSGLQACINQAAAAAAVYWRAGGAVKALLPQTQSFPMRLPSIPEACAELEEKRRAAEADEQPAAPAVCTISTAAADDCADLPACSSSHEEQQQQQRASSSGSGHTRKTRSRRSGDSSSSASSGSDAGGDANAPSLSAASAWATSIRFFACVPEQLPGQQQDQQDGQLEDYQHAASSYSLPHSSSSSSLVPACSSAAGDAALEASLLGALEELDDFDYCPWDRVASWLEQHSSSTAADDGQSQEPAAAGEAARTSSSDGQASSSSLQQQEEGSKGEKSPAAAAAAVDDEAVFDAPAWWQEAVLARLEEKREAFQGSWFSRAKVLASLAAQRLLVPCTFE